MAYKRLNFNQYFIDSTEGTHNKGAEHLNFQYVHVNAKMLSDEMLGLTVKNPYEGTIKLNKKGLPRSGKAGHGIGLSSVQAVVGRYGGSLEINTDVICSPQVF